MPEYTDIFKLSIQVLILRNVAFTVNGGDEIVLEHIGQNEYNRISEWNTGAVVTGTGRISVGWRDENKASDD